jgi:hypothetical protein
VSLSGQGYFGHAGSEMFIGVTSGTMAVHAQVVVFIYYVLQVSTLVTPRY